MNPDDIELEPVEVSSILSITSDDIASVKMIVDLLKSRFSPTTRNGLYRSGKYPMITYHKKKGFGLVSSDKEFPPAFRHLFVTNFFETLEITDFARKWDGPMSNYERYVLGLLTRGERDVLKPVQFEHKAFSKHLFASNKEVYS